MAKVYIGNLPLDCRERDLDELFFKFGRIRYIDIKNQARPPAFAFVEFEDPRDAAEAVRRRDGVEFLGHRLRVEVARGGTGQARDSFRPPPSMGYRSAGCRVTVKGLPRGASWQDLKDHIRLACRPIYTDVKTDYNGDTIGTVEFETVDDMRMAIRKLDDTEFRNPRYAAGHYVRLVEEGSGGGGGGGGGGGRGRSRSRSRSPRRPRSASPGDRDRDRDRRDDRGEDRDRDRAEPPYESRDAAYVSRARSRSRD